MNETGFRTYLKKAGKAGHVIDGLAAQVAAFEAYLRGCGVDLERATGEDIQAYAHSLAPAGPNKPMRALALYYRFAGNEALAHTAHALREAGVAKTRQSFKLRDFRGVDPAHIACLETAGLRTTEEMLAAGATPAARLELSDRSGVPLPAVLELVKLSDLARLGGVKGVRARLYYDAGLDTLAKFAGWEPDALRLMLAGWVERTGFEGIAPLSQEVRNAIATARRLPPLVEYD